MCYKAYILQPFSLAPEYTVGALIKYTMNKRRIYSNDNFIVKTNCINCFGYEMKFLYYCSNFLWHNDLLKYCIWISWGDKIQCSIWTSQVILMHSVCRANYPAKYGTCFNLGRKMCVWLRRDQKFSWRSHI